MECPLCLDVFTEDEKGFFPCPCGYQLCRLCQTKLEKCPLCHVLYIEENFQIIPDQFSQFGKNQRQHLRVIRKDCVIISNLPNSLLIEDMLSSNKFLGQYGHIYSILCECNNQKSLVYVQFASQREAENCIRSLNFSYAGGNEIHVTFGFGKFCPMFCIGRECVREGCQLLHEYDRRQKLYDMRDAKKELYKDAQLEIEDKYERETYYNDKHQEERFPLPFEVQSKLKRVYALHELENVYNSLGKLLTTIKQ